MISIVPVLSVAEDSNFHFLTASIAAFSSTGWPPIAVAVFTLPFGATTTANLTVPESPIRRAISGRVGATLVFTFRVIAS